MRRLLRLSTVLLGSLLCGMAGRCGLAQAPLPAATLTPEALRLYCAGQHSTRCILPFRGEYTLALPDDWQLPSAMHLRFAPGSALHIAGGVLHFAGGSVEAPAHGRIFPDGDHVRDLAAARPEWFSAAPEVGQEAAAALAAAYQATEPWGTIYLLPRKYVSPFTGCSPDSLRFLSPRTLVGAGRPSPDDPVHPTHLQTGTILLGGIVGTAPLRLAHLGLDAGPDVSTQLLHGCQPPAVFIEQPNHEFVSGDRLEDVSVLTTGAFNMHSVMIAGHKDAEVRGLWIWTLGGTHGLVMKSSHSVVDGLHCWGAVSDCLIVKSDYVTDFEGRAVHDRVAHVDIHPLQPGGYVGGIMVDSRWDTVSALDMEDITQTGSRYALILLGSSFFRPRGISIRNWTASATGACLFSDKAEDVQVTDFHCNLAPTAEAAVMLRHGRHTLLQRGTFLCDGSPAQCAAGQTDGVVDDATGTSWKGLVAEGLGGHFLRSLPPEPPLGDVQAPGMNGRMWAPYSVAAGARVRDILAQTKPNLRILYTAVMTRVMFHLELYGLLAVLLACIVAWEVVNRRHPPAARKHFRRT